MQTVCRSLLVAPAWPQPEVPRARGATKTTCQARATMKTRGGCARCAAPARRLRARASCGGGTTEPVEAREDGPPAGDEAVEGGMMAPEELEVLEEAAITGEDEGRRPTDYDRRAHIFEESSRVFRALKQRSDGGAGSQSGRGGVASGATAAGTTACNEQ